MACIASGCGPARIRATYQVAIRHPAEARAEIAARFIGVRGDSLTITGFGAADLVDLATLDATAAGRRLPVRISSRTAARHTAFPRVTVALGGASDIVLRYRVALGRTGGNAHIGQTGVRDDYCGGRFALVSGRNLFLLPDRSDRLGSIRVRFDLPPDWTAVTPWPEEDGVFRPGVEGVLASEHLVTAAIGLGRFRTWSARVGRTRHRFAFEQSIPESSAVAAARAMTTVARYCRDLFGRDLAATFVTIGVPEAEGGDEIQVESWGTGQGITADPFTGSALHQFALGILRAYMQHPPARSEISDPRDWWLATAVPEFFAWKALVHAGWLDESEWLREMGVAYLAAIRVRGVEHDLERLYESELQTRPGRAALGPFVLAALDRELRRRGADEVNLESIAATVFPAGRARSLWSRLPGGERAWRDFRRRYVKGDEPLAVAGIAGLTAPREQPRRAAGRARRRLDLMISGGTYGFLETCGCKSNQSGGAARRATLLRKARAEHPDLVWLDAGDTFTRAETGEHPDSLERSEQRLHLRFLTEGGCQASAVGSTELQFGVPFFREISSVAGFPYLAANLSEGGRPLGPARHIVTAAGLRLGVIGVYDPPTPVVGGPRLQRNLARLVIEDPVTVVQRETARLRGHVDLILAIGRLTPITMRRLAREVSGLDVAISTENAGSNSLGATSGPGAREDPSGFHGSLLCLYTAPLNYGLVGVGLELDDSCRIATVDFRVHLLSPGVPDDPSVRAELDRFYGELDRVEGGGSAPLFAEDRERMEARYAGADRCAGCHHDAWNQWRSTRHADAFKTLLERHRNAHPACVGCHVVGFRTRHGFRLGDREAPFGGVQCEMCHGPGAEHAERPVPGSIRREVPEAVCLECHTPDHSDRFVYAERLPMVMHSSMASTHESRDRESGRAAVAPAITSSARRGGNGSATHSSRSEAP